MNLRRKLNYYNKFIALFVAILGMTVFQSCENNPNDLGLEFILSDTLNTKLLDSNKDSLLITTNSYKRFVNTYYSNYFLVGKYQGYESQSFLRSSGVSGSYAGATVLSATIKINYAKYAYQDTTGAISFNVYSLNKHYDFSTVTYDSLNSGSIGTDLLGSYSGNPSDTNSIYIPFSNTTAKNWLEYAADTGYASKNYGIAFVPNVSSSTIKAFYGNLSSNIRPKIIIVANKNDKTDTLVYDFEAVTLSNVLSPVTYPDRFVVQNGISFFDIINFNVSKIPPNSIINEAYLRLKVDKANSFITTSSNLNMNFTMMLDTVNKTNDGTSFSALVEDSVTISVRLTPYFQKWNYGTATNYGVTFRNYFDAYNLDRFVFYGQGVQDTSKRPKLLIRYTPRGK